MTQAPYPAFGQHAPPPQGGAKLVLFATGLALVSVILVNLYILRVKRQLAEEQMPVYRLLRQVEPGDRLRQRDIEEVLVPRRFDKALASIGILDKLQVDLRIKENREYRRAAASGDLLRGSLFDEDDDSGKLVPKKGMRYVTLQVDSKFQSGSLRPGQKVDIVAPFATGGKVPETLLVMESVPIVALGTQTIQDEEEGKRRIRSYKTVTIEVTFTVATNLSMIQKMAAGEFQLLLRNSADVDSPKTRPGEIHDDVMRLLRQQIPAVRPGA